MRVLSICLITMFRVGCCKDKAIADWNVLSQGCAVKETCIFPGSMTCLIANKRLSFNLFVGGRRWERGVVDDMFTARPI